MTKSGSKYMKIKINTDTGEVVKIKDEKGLDATAISKQEAEQVEQNPNTTHIAKILHLHSSPGCVYLFLAGAYYKIFLLK